MSEKEKLLVSSIFSFSNNVFKTEKKKKKKSETVKMIPNADEHFFFSVMNFQRDGSKNM